MRLSLTNILYASYRFVYGYAENLSNICSFSCPTSVNSWKCKGTLLWSVPVYFLYDCKESFFETISSGVLFFVVGGFFVLLLNWLLLKIFKLSWRSALIKKAAFVQPKLHLKYLLIGMTATDHNHLRCKMFFI